jgi:hypothetical protein
VRILLIAFFLSLGTVVYATDILQDTELKNIRIVEIKEGKAVVQGSGGITAEVAVGDSVGREGGTVVGIEKTFIIVEIGTTRTRIPLMQGFFR